ncbi:MAG: adenylate/guanylate cyclase domain-containing protein [Pseudomonadota bacterium]
MPDPHPPEPTSRTRPDRFAMSGSSATPPRRLTLLFTDVEGSTQLLHMLGTEYDAVLSRHNQLIREVLARHDGEEVGTAGDSFFAAFETPLQGVCCAVDAQRALASADWPDGVKLRVRMGLHEGEVRPAAGEGYRGLDVHRAARISSAANGGQVLVSRNVREGVDDAALPSGVLSEDLGLHYLKDLRYPEHLYALSGTGMEAVDTPIRSQRDSPNNLPAADGGLIGRDDDIGALRGMMGDAAVRLITLTGPGGTGKTRLAVEAARGMLGQFPSGVFFVPLAAITDPDLVPIAIAQTMGVREFAGMPLARNLRAALNQGPTLLVLDNIEQVIDAASEIGALLTDCPPLKIIATSREPLNIRHERVMPVHPLPVPPGDPSMGVEAALNSPSVQLFVERASQVKRGFQLTEAALPGVLSICARLDGLPLAIELAASRMRLMSPEAIAKRLETSLEVLTGGRRDDTGRHRTLRDAIAWSYDMLDPAEQRMLAALSVFRGGFSALSADAVCGDLGGDLGGDPFDQIGTLLNRSLLRESLQHGETRLSMLETVRSFAADALAETPEAAAALAQAHAAHYRDMAVELSQELVGRDQRSAVTALFDEIDNLRTALAWATAQPDATMTAELLRALVWFWIPQGLFSEGRRWIAAALAQIDGQPACHAHAVIHDVAGWLAIFSGDYAAAFERCAAAHDLFADHGSQREQGRAKATYGITLAASGKIPEGPEMIMASLASAQEIGDEEGAAIARVALGEGARYGGDKAAAEQCYRQALEILERIGNSWWPGGISQNLAHFRLAEGNWQAAVELLARTYETAGENDYQIQVMLYLMGMSGVGLVRGEAPAAARLIGATEALLARVGAAFEPSDQAEMQAYLDQAGEVLGADALTALRAEGAGWSQEEAVAAAQALGTPG